MRGLLLLLLTILFAGQVTAQTVRVTSGEHGSFTRLVLSVPSGSRWDFGRTVDGYAFRLPGTVPNWEIGSVFDRIPRTRLASISVDSDANLRLGLGCACHAVPFAFRPDVIVIDIRDGQPPAGSSFELTFDGQKAAPVIPIALPRPRPRPVQAAALDWVDLVLKDRDAAPPQPATVATLPPIPDPALQALQEELLKGFARAAGEGLIDPVTRLKPRDDSGARPGPVPPPLRIGSPVEAQTGLSDPPPLSAEGERCPSPETLQVENWGDARPVSVQMADHMADLVGEFDQPSPDAVANAVRFHLFLGFGAEARALLRAFPTDHPDQPFWLSLGRIVDGDPDPAGALRGLAACDGPAAFWSMMSDPAVPTVQVNKNALLRAFSALPPHLRRTLGPPLINRFLAAEDQATAAALNDMLLRLPGAPDARQQIAAARVADALGSAPAAEEMLSDVLADPGPAQPEALVALVDLHLKDARPLDRATVDALAAFLAQAESPAAKEALARAHLLALALSGDFDAAFAALPAVSQAQNDLWSLLSGGPDEALLVHAVGAEGTALPVPTRNAIAERLLSLGFVQEAARWSPDPLTLPTPEPQPLRQTILARNWAELGPDAPEPWRNLAEKADQAVETGAPPLARSRSLTTASAETRAAVQALLDSLPEP
jgi:hypothetical protein